MNTQAIIILKLHSNAVPGGLLIPQTPLNARDAIALGMPPEEALNERTSIRLLSGNVVPVKHLFSDRWGVKVPYVQLTREEETGRVWEGWKSFVPANRATSGHSWELVNGMLREDFKDERVLNMAARGAALPAVAGYPYQDVYGMQNVDLHEIWRRLSYKTDTFIDEMTALVPPPLPTIPTSDVQEMLEQLAFTYHQDIPAVTWTIQHNLGRIPVVQVCDELMRVVPYDQFLTQHASENLLVIVWPGSVPRTGIVRLV